MKKLIYSQVYKRKILILKKYLDEQFGQDVRKNVLKTITNRLHDLQKHEKSGVSVRDLYQINTDYRCVFVSHNYVFYRITRDSIRIINIYHEREDYMLALFGIRSYDEMAEDYWEEVDRNQVSDQE